MNEKNEMGILLIFVGLALVVVSGFALVVEVELRDTHRTIRAYKAAIQADSIRNLEREMAMMECPGIITKVDFHTGKDIDDDKVYIHTVFPWGTVIGKCSKEFFENVHGYRQNREQMLKHLNIPPE